MKLKKVDKAFAVLAIGFTYYYSAYSVYPFIAVHSINFAVNRLTEYAYKKKYISSENKKIIRDSLNFLNVCTCQASKEPIALIFVGFGLAQDTALGLSIALCLGVSYIQKQIADELYDKNVNSKSASYTGNLGAKFVAHSLKLLLPCDVRLWRCLITAFSGNMLSWILDSAKYINSAHCVLSMLIKTLANALPKEILTYMTTACILTYDNTFGLVMCDFAKELMKGVSDEYFVKVLYPKVPTNAAHQNGHHH